MFKLFELLGYCTAFSYSATYQYLELLVLVKLLRSGQDAHRCNSSLRLPGIRTRAVCPCEDGPPEREASCSNTEAKLTLLAYMGVEIRSRDRNVASCDN